MKQYSAGSRSIPIMSEILRPSPDLEVLRPIRSGDEPGAGSRPAKPSSETVSPRSKVGGRRLGSGSVPEGHPIAVSLRASEDYCPDPFGQGAGLHLTESQIDPVLSDGKKVTPACQVTVCVYTGMIIGCSIDHGGFEELQQLERLREEFDRVVIRPARNRSCDVYPPVETPGAFSPRQLRGRRSC